MSDLLCALAWQVTVNQTYCLRRIATQNISACITYSCAREQPVNQEVRGSFVWHVILNSVSVVKPAEGPNSFHWKNSEVTGVGSFTLHCNNLWTACCFVTLRTLSLPQIRYHPILWSSVFSQMRADVRNHVNRHATMMTSSNGNIFRVTGHLCGEFTGHRWIPRTKASDAELCCFLWSVPQ